MYMSESTQESLRKNWLRPVNPGLIYFSEHGGNILTEAWTGEEGLFWLTVCSAQFPWQGRCGDGHRNLWQDFHMLEDQDAEGLGSKQRQARQLEVHAG